MTTTAVALTGNVPEMLIVLEEKLKNLKTIEETAYKCPANLDGFGNIQSEMKIENLIRAFSSVMGRERLYNEAIKELNINPAPVFNIGGANLEQWKHDINLRVQIITQKETFDKLNDWKNKMTALLDKEDQKNMLVKEMSAFLKPE